MKKILYTLSLVAAFNLYSCKDAVDVTPISDITQSSFWKTENDAQGALNGMYARLRTVATENLFMLGEARGETLQRARAGTVGYDKYYEQTLTVSNAGPSWLAIYAAIDAANLLIKYVPDISFNSESVKNDVLAQAYTNRAFMYYVLVRTYGGVPIRTAPTESYDPSTIHIPRSTTDQVFELIKEDLTKAMELYPNDNFPSGRAKWSRAAANALKGDVYLWTAKRLDGGTADFQTALTALQEVQDADVDLLPNYADIFQYNNKGNKEVLMAVQFDILESGNNYFKYMYYNSSNLPSGISQATRDVIGVIGAGNDGNSIMQASSTLRSQYGAGDTRKAGTFFEVYTTANVFQSAIAAKGKGIVEGGVRHFKDDIILYRYADVLLMIAEAKNALSQNPENEIMLVRRRAYQNTNVPTFSHSSIAANDEVILKERLLELALEGKRWWDLVRFDKAFDLVPSLQGRSSERYLLLFPIGNSLRSLEPLVEENEGWQ